jgi:hypothetical protein
MTAKAVRGMAQPCCWFILNWGDELMVERGEGGR